MCCAMLLSIHFLAQQHDTCTSLDLQMGLLDFCDSCTGALDGYVYLVLLPDQNDSSSAEISLQPAFRSSGKPATCC